MSENTKTTTTTISSGPTNRENVAGTSTTNVAESKPKKSSDRRSYYCVTISGVDKSGIAVLTINNSPKNVLDFNTLKTIVGYLRLLEEMPDCRAVIITSGCSNVFSAGFDLKEFRTADSRRLRSYWAAVFDLWFQLYKTRLATVAAINGVACGGGFVMAACCDRRIMASGCGTVGFNEVKMGITLPLWMIGRVTQLVGCHKAECILTRGQLLEADTALKYGLVDHVTSKDRLLEASYEELGKILDTPDCPRVTMKWIMRQPLIDKVLQERDRCIDILAESIKTPQAQEFFRRSNM